jgi:hypothetical protein
MPPEPPPKNVRRTEGVRKGSPAPPRVVMAAGVGPPSLPHGAALAAPIPPSSPGPGASGDVGIAVAADAGAGGVVTARRAGGLRDMALEVDPDKVGVKAALQHLAKAVNIAFQTDYGENYLESVYQAAILRNGEIQIVHKEYFGFRDTWFGQFGMLLKSMQLTFQGPDPGSPEGQKQIAEHGASTIRGLFNFLGRKLDLVAEFEDRVPAYVEQMFDRLEASGIITGWDRDDWRITTTKVGLNIRVVPRMSEMEEEVPQEG